ncbi:caspase-1-like isoform X3 [Callorhinus ursinus]|uniref:Caspase-1-like isoform X3 n=1 Tax=Callorhinus ursinus TaxID=34884 RepID=A0A3Q7QSZ0_CALUR|nr:caspase-1-like isoform X3 [Callorhinus ursinus]
MADKTLKDRRKLFVSSVNTGTLSGLLDELLEKRVLNQEETERVQYENATVTDKARALIDSVVRKGSQACNIFICYIREEDSFLAEKMGLSSGAPSESQHNSDSQAAILPSTGPEDVSGQPEPEESTDTLKLCPHEEFMKLYKEKAAEIYPIKERKDRTRLALIICNIEFDHLPPRDGAELDIAGMRSLLEGLGYSVDVKKKLTAKTCTHHVRIESQLCTRGTSWHWAQVCE